MKTSYTQNMRIAIGTQLFLNHEMLRLHLPEYLRRRSPCHAIGWIGVLAFQLMRCLFECLSYEVVALDFRHGPGDRLVFRHIDFEGTRHLRYVSRLVGSGYTKQPQTPHSFPLLTIAAIAARASAS
jgi:hypothetical protein